MFNANVLTAWIEALNDAFHDPDFDERSPLKDIPISSEFPMKEIQYPGLWVNYTMQGDMKNVGIGHEEYYLDEDGSTNKVFRWHFGGLLEITIGAMGNLERARIFDALTTAIAVARVDENVEGDLRKNIEQNDLVGQIVTWESITVSGFGETPGTPWGTDDVIYEVTISLTSSGEVVLDPTTATLVPLSKVVISSQIEGYDESGEVLPTPGSEGWI